MVKSVVMKMNGLVNGILMMAEQTVEHIRSDRILIIAEETVEHISSCGIVQTCIENTIDINAL